MISWYLNRLRTFSLAEIPYRVCQLLQKKYEAIFVAGKYWPDVRENKQPRNLCFFTDAPVVYPEVINVFGRTLSYADTEIDWHKDVFTGESFDITFAKAINIRSNPSLSAKNVWEVNRLLFLPQIALNYRSTHDSRYLKQFTEIMSSWIDKNPYLMGVNWYSNIEVNIRLISWFISWQILDADKLAGEDSDFRKFMDEKWLPAIYLHCLYSYKNPSRYSSSNNHLIAEYSGLYIASSFWNFKESRKWNKYSGRGLEKEIQRQHSSGINREEAAEYIQFITDFFLFPYIVAERSGKAFSARYRETLSDILLYIAAFLDCKGNFPKYGDEDDGKCITLNLEADSNNFESLLVTAAVMFNDSRFKRDGMVYDLKNHFLFGHQGKKMFEELPAGDSLSHSSFFPEEGHFIFRKSSGDREIYMHFDAAPLGFLSIAAHGHADALSFILSVNGNQIFSDSGTFTYHTFPQWRHYFIGTIAHNTIRIDRRNQALIGGPTLWLNHFKCSVIENYISSGEDYVKASHNGYEKRGVLHQREILFDKNNDTFFITDTLILNGRQPVFVEIPFHLHPDVEVEIIEKGIFALKHSKGETAHLELDGKLTARIVNGAVNPEILGWYSESFCKKEASNTIYSSIEITESTVFKHQIKIN